MSPGQATALIGTLAVLLAVASAMAGALWYKLRALPALRATLLARDLVERLQFLEELIARLESAEGTRKLPPHLRAATTLRVDPPSAPISARKSPAASEGPALSAQESPTVFGAVQSSNPAQAANSPGSRAGGHDDRKAQKSPAPEVAPAVFSETPTLIAVPDMSTPTNDHLEPEVILAERFQAIWALADRGRSAEAISRQAGLPIGQIELILGLRRRLLPSERLS